MTQAPKPDSRSVAARIVGRWLETGLFPDRLMDDVAQDRAFVMEMVYGVVKWRRALEWVLSRYARRKPDTRLVPFLLIGLYQVLKMDHVAVYAAVSETVEAAKRAGPAHAVGFINAVLRRAAREAEMTRVALSQQSRAIRESHPDLLVQRWVARYGAVKTDALLDWNNSRPSVTVRVRRPHLSVPDFLAKLRTAGGEGTPHPFAPEDCVEVGHGARVRELPGYAEGLFTVQDPSTLAAVDLLGPQAGEDVLDACAAPGGKTILMADRMSHTGQILAMDPYENRLTTLLENVNRIRTPSVRVVCGDATKEADIRQVTDRKTFDRILLDVPCTNTGVLRRRPDARWRFSTDRLAELAGVQIGLLDTCSRFLAPSGRLVYNTCSLEAEEGGDRVRTWIAAHPEFRLVEEMTLFPPDTRTDGAYAAAIERVPPRV